MAAKRDEKAETPAATNASEVTVAVVRVWDRPDAAGNSAIARLGDMSKVWLLPTEQWPVEGSDPFGPPMIFVLNETALNALARVK